MAQRPESRTPSRLLGEDAAIQRLRVWTPLSWRLTWGRKVELLARGSTGEQPTLTPQRRDHRLEAAIVAAVGAVLIPAIGACAFRGA